VNPELVAIAVLAGIGVYATSRAVIKFCEQHLSGRLHNWKHHTTLADRIEPYTRQSRVLLGADPHGDVDVVGSEAERWLADHPPDADGSPAD
jgi:hypothetical protein